MVVARSTSKGIFVFKITMEKKCTKCGEVNSLDEFSNDKSSKDGKQFRCKSCCKESREELKRYKANNMSTLEFIKLFNDNHALKKCTKCKVVKSLDEFGNERKNKSGKASQCKICLSVQKRIYWNNNRIKLLKLKKIYRDNNKETIKEREKIHYHKNKQEILDKQKIYNQKNKQALKKRQKIYQKINKESITENFKKYYKKNKGKIREYGIKYREINKEKINIYKEKNKEHRAKMYKLWRIKNKENINENARKRKKTDVVYRLSCIITTNISDSLKRQGYSKKTKAYNILKCEFSFFMDWLNGVASNGYTYGIGDLHLDHVVPISLSETEEELLLLNHYSNFQLLNAFDNISKGNRYVNPVNLARVLEHHPEPNKIKEIYSRL